MVFKILCGFAVLAFLFCNAAKSDEGFDRISQYRFAVLKPDEEQPLKISKQSTLNWSNPVFGTTDGGLFLWTNNDRPAAIMKTYKTKNGRWFEQVRSLSVDRLRARDADGKVFWSPTEGVPPMTVLKPAPIPAETALQRLVQMKAIHRSFEVEGDIKNAGGKQLLRNYPKPIYRYANQELGLIDGAIFAFTQGTGPDVVLMLEARKMDEGSRWFYRLAAIGIFAITVSYKDQEVWTEKRRTAQSTLPTDIYDGRPLPL